MTTAHAALLAALTAPEGDHVDARIYLSDGTPWLSMLGRTFPLRADSTATRGDLAAAVYSTKHGTSAGLDDVLTVADDGTAYASAQAFEAGAAPLCVLSDPGARAAIVAHLGLALSTRAAQ